MKKPRLIAICYIRDGDRIFVGDHYDPTKRQRFHRPLGGGIEWWETGMEAVKREFREEAGAELIDLRFERVLENFFTFDGIDGHEVVMVFSGRFKDSKFYEMQTVECVEDKGIEFEATWINLNELSDEIPIYPEGLLEHIQSAIE